ncbi:MAG: acetoacetate decarboxylase family protein [Candidatus Latescibacteria bacterium]|nr:acetoacetate decarboxylase family protein [Candidatus Latescibacterota bacterium]
MAIPLDTIANMPAYSPYYPMPPARYQNVRFQFVSFRADVSAVDRVLPACFTPSADGFCVAIGLSVPWSANYGAFEESVLIVKCVYEGQVGYFAPVVFLNSRSSIPAGREIYGTPKVFADVKVGMDERVMYTDTWLAGVSVMSVRSTMQREATIEEMPRLQPSWRLKVIPRADGKGADVMQVIDVSKVTTEITVHVCRAGEGVVQFHPVPVYDLSDFTPREHYGAHYVEMDYTEGYAEVVYDFLHRA